MAKTKTAYVCQECGASAPRWMGKCAGCGAWNTLVEERTSSSRSRPKVAGIQAKRVSELSDEHARHRPSGIEELDRVLGGGLVQGGLYLVGGEPGIGKSTLLMQVLASLCRQGQQVLYVTGEESAAQVAMRARRVGRESVANVAIISTSEFEDVSAAVDTERPDVLVVDSIQTVRSAALDSAPGTVSQLREVTSLLMGLAKRKDISTFVVGHVTKEGVIAGPKTVEHMVDVVLTVEGDTSRQFRLVRASKNRYGATGEVGVFEMRQTGLEPVADPSGLFLAERPADAPGSVVLPTCEGSRPLLVELQALTAPALYGASRRVASGVDTNRVAVLLAVIERKLGLHIADRDVFASVAGGMRVSERASDLALALAIVSSLKNRPLPADLAAFAEIGLAGELRGVSRADARVAECRKLGFEKVIMAKSDAKASHLKSPNVMAAASLEEAVDLVF